MLTTAQPDQHRTYLSETASPPSICLFIFLAYAISWYAWIWAGHFDSVFYIQIGTVRISAPVKLLIVALGNFGPAVSATLVAGLTEGHTGIRKLWGALTRCGLKLRWLLGVFLLVPCLYALAIILYAAVGGKIGRTENPIQWLFLIVQNLPVAGLGEEIGWRGFLLPRLEAKYNGLLSSLITATIWVPWHIPLYSGESMQWWSLFVITVFALAVTFTWIYNSSQGALFPVVLLHSIVNATVIYLLGPTMQLRGMAPLRFSAAVVACAAFLIIAFVGPDLSRNSLTAPGFSRRCIHN